MRQLLIDTETTGLDVNEGHKIIEFVALEMIDRKITNNYIQFYFDPQRPIDIGATKIHGISNEDLIGKPKFSETIDQIINFINGSEIIIHNAKFDISFLNKEFLSIKKKSFESYVHKITDTLIMARSKFPGAKNSLDILCDRFNIDKSKRMFHGALIDCELLAEVYLKLTEEKNNFLSFDGEKIRNKQISEEQFKLFDTSQYNLKIIKANSEEVNKHQQYIEELNSSTKGKCEWFNINNK